MKKTLSFLLAFVMLFSLLAVGASAANTVLSAQKLACEGNSIECEKYNIDGSNYFKLRDIAYLLNGTVSQFSVGWDAEARVVSIVTGEAYEPNGSELVFSGDKSSTAVESSQTVKINGLVRDDLSVYNIGGSNFFKLRDLGGALGFLVDYDKASNTAVIKSLKDAVNPDEWLLKRSSYVNYEGEIYYYTDYTYNDKKQLLSTTETYPYGDGSSVYSTEYTYDAAGNRTSLFYSSLSGDGYWYRSDFTYDAAGNMLSEVDTSSGESTYTSYFTYNASGLLIKETYESISGDYRYSGTSEYTYDSAGNMLTEVYSSADGGMSTTINTYDALGNMLSSSYRSASGYSSQDEYVYDDAGNLICETYTAGYADGGSYTTSSVYEYDAKGNMVRETYQSEDYSSEAVFTYYDNGEMRSRRTDFSDGSYSYTEYGADGRILEDGYVEEEYSNISVYSYDALGNMLSCCGSFSGESDYFTIYAYDYTAGTYTEYSNMMYGIGGMG